MLYCSCITSYITQKHVVRRVYTWCDYKVYEVCIELQMYQVSLTLERELSSLTTQSGLIRSCWYGQDFSRYI